MIVHFLASLSALAGKACVENQDFFNMICVMVEERTISCKAALESLGNANHYEIGTENFN
ncbi:hypothetical protein NTGZN8_10010 [Candidatus Nitrotoga fabula]|uniref:Uncharacterized protein n=1 Tax=Candidatus Nitrotoga fabula TaxID=2182327 RepID=A0A916F9A1_9PROT|nr:hypothetical protein NTGZN8_10010 [Candidatus Nitrotoga fabula]